MQHEQVHQMKQVENGAKAEHTLANSKSTLERKAKSISYAGAAAGVGNSYRSSPQAEKKQRDTEFKVTMSPDYPKSKLNPRTAGGKVKGRGKGKGKGGTPTTDSPNNGMIFQCSDKTYQECIDRQLFGLPSAPLHNIKAGVTPLFLQNFVTKELHGVFQADTDGQKEIEPYAWTGTGLGVLYTAESCMPYLNF